MATKPLLDLPPSYRPGRAHPAGVAPVAPPGTPTITLRRPAWLPGVELWSVRRSTRPWSMFYGTYAFVTASRLEGPYECLCRQQRQHWDTASVVVAEPGDLQVRLEPTFEADLDFLVVAPEVVKAVLDENGPGVAGGPATRHFSSSRIDDPGLVALVSRLWGAISRITEQATVRGGSASTWPGAPPPRRPARAVVSASSDTVIEQQHLLRAFIRTAFESATGREPPATIRPRDRAVARVCQILEQEYQNRITLDRLARETGFSKYYLERTFHDQIGVPVHQYLKKVRVAQALDLLRKGQRPSAIATKTGFSDQPHLTRVFREELGFTPRTYWAALTALTGQA